MDMEKMDALAGTMAALDDELTPRTPEERAAEDKAAAEADPEFQAKAWAEMAKSIGGLLSMIEPALEQVYTERACLQWGRAVVPVAEKYGWNGPSSIPELGLLIATVPLALPTGFLLHQRIKALRKAAAQAEEACTVENGAPAGDAS